MLQYIQMYVGYIQRMLRCSLDSTANIQNKIKQNCIHIYVASMYVMFTAQFLFSYVWVCFVYSNCFDVRDKNVNHILSGCVLKCCLAASIPILFSHSLYTHTHKYIQYIKRLIVLYRCFYVNGIQNWMYTAHAVGVFILYINCMYLRVDVSVYVCVSLSLYLLYVCMFGVLVFRWMDDMNVVCT